MQCGTGVITQAILVSCMLCSKALSPLFPLSLQRRVGVLQDSRQRFFRLSIVSLVQKVSIGGRQSLETTAGRWAQGCGRCLLPCPVLTVASNVTSALPLLFLIRAFASMPKTRLKNAASFLLKGLSFCMLFLPNSGAWK